MMPSHTNAQSELLPLSYLSFHPRLLAAGTKGHNSFLDTIAAGPWEEEQQSDHKVTYALTGNDWNWY